MLVNSVLVERWAALLNALANLVIWWRCAEDATLAEASGGGAVRCCGFVASAAHLLAPPPAVLALDCCRERAVFPASGGWRALTVPVPVLLVALSAARAARGCDGHRPAAGIVEL